jgi:hypothetical protein
VFLDNLFFRACMWDRLSGHVTVPHQRSTVRVVSAGLRRRFSVSLNEVRAGNIGESGGFLAKIVNPVRFSNHFGIAEQLMKD